MMLSDNDSSIISKMGRIDLEHSKKIFYWFVERESSCIGCHKIIPLTKITKDKKGLYIDCLYACSFCNHSFTARLSNTNLVKRFNELYGGVNSYVIKPNDLKGLDEDEEK